MCNQGFWGGNCCWIIVILILCLVCGGCGNGCGNGCVQGFTSWVHGDDQLPQRCLQQLLRYALSLAADHHRRLT